MPRPAVVALAAALLLGASFGATPFAGASYPVLPASDGGELLSNLSAPVLDPGGSGPIGYELANPFAATMSSIRLEFGVYAFSAYPGNSTSPLPASGVPALAGPNGTGSSVTVLIGALPPGGTYPGPSGSELAVSAPSSAPSGTFSIRTALTFTEGGSVYRFESRGYFSTAQWENATLLTNRTSTLNLSRLGVSGVLPETAVLVEGPSLAPWIDAILGGSIVLAAVGGYVAWRRGPGSSSGARPAAPSQSAPRALGTSRTSDGD